jgi:hypothetical protein
MAQDHDNEQIEAYVQAVLTAEVKCLLDVTPASVREMVGAWHDAHVRLARALPDHAPAGLAALAVTHLARALGSELFADKT